MKAFGRLKPAAIEVDFAITIEIPDRVRLVPITCEPLAAGVVDDEVLVDGVGGRVIPLESPRLEPKWRQIMAVRTVPWWPLIVTAPPYSRGTESPRSPSVEEQRASHPKTRPLS